jgi:hypothetical protein
MTTDSQRSVRYRGKCVAMTSNADDANGHKKTRKGTKRKVVAFKFLLLEWAYLHRTSTTYLLCLFALFVAIFFAERFQPKGTCWAKMGSLRNAGKNSPLVATFFSADASFLGAFSELLNLTQRREDAKKESENYKCFTVTPMMLWETGAKRSWAVSHSNAPMHP